MDNLERSLAVALLAVTTALAARLALAAAVSTVRVMRQARAADRRPGRYPAGGPLPGRRTTRLVGAWLAVTAGAGGAAAAPAAAAPVADAPLGADPLAADPLGADRLGADPLDRGPTPVPAPAATDPATRRTVLVRPGDSLWSIAARHLGPDAAAAQVARAWPRWWRANRAVIGPDPGRLYPGQRLVPPA